MLKVGGLLQKAAGAGGDLVERAGGGAGGFLEKVRAKSDLDPLGAALRQLLNTESAAVPKEVLEDLCRRASEDQEGAGGRVARHIESHLKANSQQWRRIHGALALLDHALRVNPADVEALGKWGLKFPELRTELRGLMSFDKDKDLRACKLVQNKASAVDRELERCGIPGPPTAPKPRPSQAATEKPKPVEGVNASMSNGNGPTKAKAKEVVTAPISMGRLKFDELPTRNASPQSPRHSDSDKECEETDELYPSSPKKRAEPSEAKPAQVISLGDWGLNVSDSVKEKISEKLPIKLSPPTQKATVVGKTLKDNEVCKEYSEEQQNLLGGVNVKKEALKDSSVEVARSTSRGKCCSSLCRCFFNSTSN